MKAWIILLYICTEYKNQDYNTYFTYIFIWSIFGLLYQSYYRGRELVNIRIPETINRKAKDKGKNIFQPKRINWS